MEHDERTSSITAPLLIVIGGVFVIVSFAVRWGRVGFPLNIDIEGGPIVLVAGLVVIGLGIARWVATSRAVKITVSIVAILGGLLAISIGAAATSKTYVRDAAADKYANDHGLSHHLARAAFKQAEDSGRITVSTQPGGLFALVGGVLMLAGGIGGFATGRGAREPQTPETTSGAPPPPPAPPVSGTGPATPPGPATPGPEG